MEYKKLTINIDAAFKLAQKFITGYFTNLSRPKLITKKNVEIPSIGNFIKIIRKK